MTVNAVTVIRQLRLVFFLVPSRDRCLAQVAHVVGDVAFMQQGGAPGVPKGWAAAQAATSADFSHGSFFWTHISGGLNYQVRRLRLLCDGCRGHQYQQRHCRVLHDVVACIRHTRFVVSSVRDAMVMLVAGGAPPVPLNLPHALPGHRAHRPADLQGVQRALHGVPHGAAELHSVCMLHTCH